MPEMTSAEQALRPPGAALANGLDPAHDNAAHPAAELAAIDETRTLLRREADKTQLHIALKDLAEGLRGMIRVAPFASVAAGVAVGLLLGRRRRPRRPPPRRA